MSDTWPGQGWQQGPQAGSQPPPQPGAVPPPPGPAVPPAPTSPRPSSGPTAALLVVAVMALFVSFVCAVVLGLDDDFFTSVKIELASWLRDLGLLAAAVLALAAVLPKVLQSSTKDDDGRHDS